MVVILSCAIPKWDGDFDHLKTLLMCSRSCDFHSFDFAALLKPVPLWNGSSAKCTDAQTQWPLRSAVIEMAVVVISLYRAGAVPLPVLLRPDAILNASKPGFTAGKLKNFGGGCLKLSWLDHIGSYWIVTRNRGKHKITHGETMGTWSRFTVGFCTCVLVYGSVCIKHHTPTGPVASLGSSVNQTIFLWNPAVEVDFIGEPKAAQFDMLPSSESGKPIGFARSCKDRRPFLRSTFCRSVSSLCMAARSLDFSCWGMGKECFHCHFGKFGNICKENKWPIAFQPVRATRPSEGSLRGFLSLVSTREPTKSLQTGVQD